MDGGHNKAFKNMLFISTKAAVVNAWSPAPFLQHSCIQLLLTNAFYSRSYKIFMLKKKSVVFHHNRLLRHPKTFKKPTIPSQAHLGVAYFGIFRMSFCVKLPEPTKTNKQKNKMKECRMKQMGTEKWISYMACICQSHCIRGCYVACQSVFLHQLPQ